jgi:uncharacterized protein (TIGR00255 family)
MTGFGSAQIDCPAGRLALEIKSVNSRYFEFHARLPDEFRWAESLLREPIHQTAARGKVELKLSLQRSETALPASRINPDGLASALRLAHEIRQGHPEISPFSVADLLRLPGVVQEHQLSQEVWTDLLHQALTQAISVFASRRAEEGRHLAQAISQRLASLEALCGQAKTLVPQAIDAQRQRLTERLIEALPQELTSQADLLAALEARIRQEAAVFGLRIDVAEELDRLESHIQAMSESLARPGQGSIGKRLDFLAQEMNREANTLGSKSPSTGLSNISIDMKLLIEQIREQAQNLE